MIFRKVFFPVEFLFYLEYVCPSVHGHRHPQQEEEDADGRGEFAPALTQQLGKHVHQARHQALHDAELAVDPDGLEEGESFFETPGVAHLWLFFRGCRAVTPLGLIFLREDNISPSCSFLSASAPAELAHLRAASKFESNLETELAHS